MNTDETITTYLKLLGITNYIPDTSTTYLQGIHLQQLWRAFQEFSRIPLECQSQIFSFEYHYSELEKTLSIIFRRNFYIPFEDDPDALCPLCFEVGANYFIAHPLNYEYIFFITEVETDLNWAIHIYCNEVEKYRPYWEPFLDINPSEAYVFQ
jgi:hypothetical protein